MKKTQDIDILKLIYEPKEFSTVDAYFPGMGQSVALEGTGQNTGFSYIVDINRKQCTLSRITYQNRVFTSVILLRLDLDSKPHRNPGNADSIGGHHLHIYKDGFEDSWAYEFDDPRLKGFAPGFDFSRLKTTNKETLFYAFSELCNFVNKPNFKTMPLI